MVDFEVLIDRLSYVQAPFLSQSPSFPSRPPAWSGICSLSTKLQHCYTGKFSQGPSHRAAIRQNAGRKSSTIQSTGDKHEPLL